MFQCMEKYRVYITCNTYRGMLLEAGRHPGNESIIQMPGIRIGNDFFFVPWFIWRDMKQCFGRKYVTAADLESFRIRFNGAVLFLDYTHQIEGRWIRGADCNMEKWRETGNEKRETAPAESDGPRHAADSIQP